MITVDTFLKETKFTLIGYEKNEKYFSVDLSNQNDCRANELENLIEINFYLIKYKSIFDLTHNEKLAIARVLFQSSTPRFCDDFILKLDYYIDLLKKK